MRQIYVHLSEGFPALSLMLVTEPLRVANRELGHRIFSWQLVSEEGVNLRSSSRFDVPTITLLTAKPDALILLASYRPERAATEAPLAWFVWSKTEPKFIDGRWLSGVFETTCRGQSHY